MVLRARQLRTIGAAVAITLISQIGLSSGGPARAVEPPGPGDPGGSTGPATTLSASATTVDPGGSVTFTASVADGGAPLTSGTFALLANADAGSVFTCATVCSTMMASAAPNGAGQATFTVTMDDATFIAKDSAIRPSSEEPVHFGVMYSPPFGSELASGRSATLAVTAREVPPVVVDPVPTTTQLSTVGVSEMSIGSYLVLSAKVTTAQGNPASGVVHFYATSTDDRTVDKTRISPAAGHRVTTSGVTTHTAKMAADWFDSTASGPARPIPSSSLRFFAEFTPSNADEQPASSSSLVTVAFRKIATPITLVRTDGSGAMKDDQTAYFRINLPADAVGKLSIACPGSSCTTSTATVIGALNRQVTVSNTGNAPVERTITATFRSTIAKYADATASTKVTVDPAVRASQSIPDIDQVSSTFDLTIPSGSGSDHGRSTEVSAALAYGQTRGGTVSVASWDGSPGRTGTAAHRKAATKVVRCAAVKRGSLLCLLGSYKPGTRLRITAVVDVPAAMAGKTATLTSSVTALDPVTGVTTTLLTRTTRHTIAKRTALGGGLKPGATSVRRGKKATYSATLTNGGLFAAKGVKTCLQTAKGVKIAKAKRAKLNKAKTKACWTTSLKPRKSASFKITFTAPRKKGKTAVTWTVRPKKSQAAGFTLKTRLPVK